MKTAANLLVFNFFKLKIVLEYIVEKTIFVQIFRKVGWFILLLSFDEENVSFISSHSFSYMIIQIISYFNILKYFMDLIFDKNLVIV